MNKTNEARQAGKRPNKQQGGQGVEQNISALRQQYTEAQVKRARRVLARFGMWCYENPDALRHAEGYAVAKAAKGERISAQAIIEDVRRIDFTDTHGKPTRTNNDFAPILARWIVARHPETAEHIERRRCIFDHLVNGGDREAV